LGLLRNKKSIQKGGGSRKRLIKYGGAACSENNAASARYIVNRKPGYNRCRATSAYDGSKRRIFGKREEFMYKKILCYLMVIVMTTMVVGVSACDNTEKNSAETPSADSVTSVSVQDDDPAESTKNSASDAQSVQQSDSGSQQADISGEQSDSGSQQADISGEQSDSGSQQAGEDPNDPIAQSDIRLYQYFATETLPCIYIETEGGIAIDDASLINPDEKKGMMNEIPVYNYVGASISVTDAGDGYDLSKVAAEVKVRGNYTSTYEKKPIRIKFKKKQKMAGLNNGAALKNWVLLAEYKDSSMLRNSVAAYLGNSLLEGYGGYATDFRYVKVYINNAYHGLYVLAEQQQVNSKRVNVAEPEDPDDYDLENLSEADYAKLHDVHFGYLVEYDGYYAQEADLEKFTINYNRLNHLNGTSFNPQPSADNNGGNGGWGGGWGGWNQGWGNTRTIGFSIKNDVYFAEQRDFIKKCMQTIWNVIYDAIYHPHTDLSTQPYHTMDADGNYVADTTITGVYEAVSKVVNVKSLVDMYIIQEICEDMDISWSSFFFSIDMSPNGDKKLTYTAPWDFDSSLGSASGATAANDSLYAMNTDNPWLVVFAGQDWFWKLVNDRFEEAEQVGVFAGVVRMIDDFTTLYAAAYAENYARWPNSIGRKIESTQVSQVATFRTQADASAYLKQWLTTRISNLKTLFKTQAGVTE